jgi:hypothetical protein
MKIRTFALTAAAALFVAGSAFAQSNGTGSGGTGNNGANTTVGSSPGADKAGKAATSSMGSKNMYKSDDEKMMYQKNVDMMGPFFTDKSMSKLKSKKQIKKVYTSMDSQSQEALKKSCEATKGQRGSYGTMTMTLCQDIGTM